MKKSELIEKLSAETGLSKAAVEKVLDAYGTTAVEAIRQGDEVPLQGVGKLSQQKRNERPGRNPKTGEPVTIPASFSVKLTVGKAAKDALN